MDEISYDVYCEIGEEEINNAIGISEFHEFPLTSKKSYDVEYIICPKCKTVIIKSTRCHFCGRKL